jgi:hypothetical protein
MKQYILGLLTGLVLGLCAVGTAQLINSVPTAPNEGVITYQLSNAGSYALGVQFLSLTNEFGTQIFSIPTMIGGMTNVHCRIDFDFYNSLPAQTTNWNNILTMINITPLPR